MPLFVQKRQESGQLNFVRVVLLSAAAVLSVGFSYPERGGVQVKGAPELGSAEATPLITEQPEALPVIASLKPPAPRRPASYAADPSLESVLGEVSSRHWVLTSMYSPDRARQELQQMKPAAFHGVGFPDIQTHRSNAFYFDPTADIPHRWNQMISWRGLSDDQQTAEPIAHVRCMGLSPQAVARRADKFDSLILDLAMEHNVSASLIKAVVTEESCFNTKALSPVGAQGLMQLMPDTATWLKVRDVNDPEDNLSAGVRYLAYLKGKFDTTELVLAAYNAGPGNVRRYGGIPPFAETQAYVQKVQSNYRRYAAATRLAIR